MNIFLWTENLIMLLNKELTEDYLNVAIALTRYEIRSILKVCQSDSPIDIRDIALIAILRVTGLRRAELVKLDLEDLVLCYVPSIRVGEYRFVLFLLMLF